MFTRLLNASGEITPEQSGHFAGQAIWFIILLIGAIKCWKISSRPTTNRKCALSLMYALLAFMGFACVGILSKTYGPTPTVRVLLGIFGIGLTGLMIFALVIAILGLSEYAKQSGVYIQGRAQAIWTLILAAFILCTAGWGFINRLRNGGMGGFVVKQGQPGKMVDYPEFNFRFRSPERPWVAIDLSKLNKDSKVSYMRPLPDTYFIIIPENLGGASMTTEQLVALAQARMETVATSVKVIKETPLRVNNLDGILVEQEAQLGNRQLFYMRWAMATNGYAYQLMGYGKAEDRLQFEGELRQMISRFELIDPYRIAAAKSTGYTTNFSSPAHFYTVDIAKSSWHDYTTLKEHFPRAEFGASLGDSCFVILPVWLGGQFNDREALTAGLFATMDIRYPDDELTHRQTFEENGGSGLQYDYQRKIDGSIFRYRFRVIQQGEYGYLIAAWTQRNAESADAVLNDALKRVKITAPKMTLLSVHPRYSAQDLKNQSYVLNQAGVFRYKSEEYEKALPMFRAAVGVDITDTSYLRNLLLTWSRLGQTKEGLDYLNAQPKEIFEKPVIRASQAYFQSQCGLTDEAVTNYALAFSDGYRNTEDFTEYVNLLVTLRQYDKALAEVDRFLKVEDSADIRLLKVGIYQARHEYDKAAKFLEGEHEKSPYNSKLTRMLVWALLNAERPNEGLTYCRELLKEDDSSYAAYYLKAQCEINLKWYREAKTSLEAAMKLEPSNKDVKSSLNYVSALLGEGNNSMIKEPIAPVLRSADITNRPIEIPAQGYAKDFGAYYSQSIFAIAYKPHAEYTVTEYMTIEVLDAAGVAAFSTYQLPFDPLSEDLFVNESQVLDGSGKVLTTIKPSDCYVIDNAMGGKVSHKKIMNIPVAGLQPGCKLSLVITRRWSSERLDEFPFLDHAFSRNFPVLVAGVFLKGDASGLKIRATSGIQRENFKDGVYWSITNPMVARWEPLQPPADTFLPMLWIADGEQKWEGLATNYLASINDRLQPDEGVRLKAQQLVGDLKDDAAKLAVLSRYVQNNCTYKAIEFGRHSRTPNKAADTLRNSYGDCKDHAVLLQQLLKSVGIPAYLTLVSSQMPVQADLPSLDQFDHMIVALPQNGGERFVDCTDKGADLTNGVPSGLADQQVLILDPANPHFAKVPSYPENASSVEIQQQVSLSGAADLAVDETMSLTGIHGAFLRNYLKRLSPTYRQEALQREMGMADTTISHFEVSSLENPNQPLVVKYSFILKNQFHQTQDGLVGMLRAGFERGYLSPVAAVASRLTPFENTIPFRLRSHVVFAPPKGYHVIEKPDSKDNLNSRFFTYQAQHKLVDGNYDFSFQCQQSVGHFKANDYSSYQDSLTQIQASMDHEVVLQADAH